MENINIQDSDIKPEMTFKHLVYLNMQKLTNFPYIEKDFDALTDYQLLCLVVKYLNDVIENSNEQNASIMNLYNAFLALQDYMNNSVQELEDAWNAKTTELEEDWLSKTTEIETSFNQLHDYVQNYFANLDVQEEIDNKLDEMLEQGVLEQIIEQFIQSTALWCFDTVADMKLATNFTNGSYAKTLGYYSIKDGGSSVYKIRTKTNEDVTDEITLIELYNDTLVAELIFNNELHVKQCGAYGDNTHDDTSAINNCANICDTLGINMIIDNGTYLTSDTLIMPTNVDIISKNVTINSSLTTGDIICCDKSGYITGSQPKYTMKGNLRIHDTDSTNTAIGLHIGASKKANFEDITITNTYEAGILVKSTHSGDVDNFNLNLCHCYNTGGLVLESGADEITSGSITDGSVRNCIFDSPLQKSAITINKNSNKSIFGVKFDRNFLNARNYPVLTISNSDTVNYIYYLEFIENSVELRNASNHPVYASITGVSNSTFDFTGMLINTSGYDINRCKNCTFKRVEYTGYYGLEDKIIDIDSDCYNITFENLSIPLIDFWYNTSKNYNAQLKTKWNSLIKDSGYNTKIINSLPFVDTVTAINKWSDMLSLAEVTPTTDYSLRFATATKSNNQLTVTLENGQNSPWIAMPIFDYTKDFVGIHIRFKLNNAFDPTGNAKLRLIPFNNFNINLDNPTVDEWYDVCLIVPTSQNKTYFGVDGYLNTDLSITIDKFEVIDNFQLPYFYNYNVIEK